MKQQISHDRREETMEAKARWFQSLSLLERMEVMTSYIDLLLSLNPSIAEQKHAQSPKGRVQVLSKT